jgi:RND family efflux transporter MFP subunit
MFFTAPRCIHSRFVPALVLAVSAVAQAAASGAPPDGLPQDAVIGCLLMPHAEARVGSPVVGVLSEVLVDRGSVVKKGEPLARLLNRVEAANVGAASQRYASAADVEAARMAADLAKKKAVRARELHELNFISAQALDQAVAEADVAAMQYTRAREQRKTVAKELSVATAQLALRTITSPLDGVVAERFLSAGERVEDKPVVKVVQIDPLRVEVVLSADRFGSIAANQQASVTPEMKGAAPMRAQVVQVDSVVDVASNTFRVRLQVPNPGNRIPPGLRCKVSFPE